MLNQYTLDTNPSLHLKKVKLMLSPVVVDNGCIKWCAFMASDSRTLRQGYVRLERERSLVSAMVEFNAQRGVELGR